MRRAWMNKYGARQIGDGVWEIIDCPDGVRATVNVYLVEGKDRAVLVDAGDSKSGLKEFVESLTDKPITLLITHGHGDHTGAGRVFEDVYAPHVDLSILRDLFGEEIYEKDVKDLEAGQLFDLGGRTLEVLSLTGHTRGSVALLDETNQLLFSSDGLGSDQLWLQLPHSTTVTDFNEVLQGLRERLEPLKNLKIWAGHNCFRDLNLGHAYIQDLHSIVEGVISGTMVGLAHAEGDEFFGGKSVEHGLVKAFIYKPDRI